MRILLDHNVPAPLRYALRGHQVETAFKRDWGELKNGELLSAAEKDGFDILITTDQGIPYQQNLTGRSLSILVLSTNDWTRLRLAKQLITFAVNSMSASQIKVLDIPLR